MNDLVQHVGRMQLVAIDLQIILPDGVFVRVRIQKVLIVVSHKLRLPELLDRCTLRRIELQAHFHEVLHFIGKFQPLWLPEVELLPAVLLKRGNLIVHLLILRVYKVLEPTRD